jgi:hypothetical protein
MTADDFEIGKTYFSCAYVLRFRPVPIIEAAVFLGKNILGVPDDGDYHYFQDPGCYYREERNFEAMQEGREGISDEDGDGIFFVPSANVADFMTDLKGLQAFVARLETEPGAVDTFGGNVRGSDGDRS